MKLSRHKYIRRLLNYYKTYFNIKNPFIILIDGTFTFEALQCKIQIDDQLKSYLETNNIICSTTLCAIKETELLGKIGFGSMLILKQYSIIKCNHYPSISPEKCFQQILINNKNNKYFLASQSLSLREYCHEYRPDLPTMLITYNSINLERPSIKSLSIVKKIKNKQINLTEYEKNILKNIKLDLNIEENENNINKKKKKHHGINPLSKKKKTKKNFILNKNLKKKRIRTRQIRMSKHLKEHLNELKKNFSIKNFLKIK